MKESWRSALAAAVIGVLVALCVAPEALYSFVNHVGFGWFAFLKRVGPTIEWHPLGWFLAMAAFGLIAFGVQRVVSSKISGWTWTRSLAAVALAVLACVASISLVGAVHELGWMATSKRPIVVTPSDWRRRELSSGNLRQIGFAIHGYEHKTGVFPTLGPVERGGAVMPGWTNLIEPYLEHETKGTDAEDRQRHAPVVLQNPGLGFYGRTEESHYAGNVRLLGRTTPTKLEDITDGTSNTLMAGEIESGFRPWRDPGQLRDPALGIRPGNDTFCGPWEFRRGAFFLKADGSVHFMSNMTNPKVLKALATPDSGDGADLEGNWEK